MAQKNKAQSKKLRDDLDPAHNLYEDWLEPDWRGSTATPGSSGPKDPKLKDRSKFKFAKDYEREISTNGSNIKRSRSSTDLKTNKGWVYQEADFERFYAWVINGTLGDLHLAKSLLFYD